VRKTVVSIVASLAMAASSTPSATAQTAAADKFKGKTFEVVVGYDTGGGYDIYGRALSRHIGKHLPGNPTVILKNMPGAQTRTAANYLYNIAPKDGTVIATVARGLPTDELLGSGGIRFESTKFNWIGSMNNEVSVGVAWHTSPIKTFEDTKNKEMIVGAIADSLLFAQVMNAVLGTKFKMITGYKSGAEIGLAMERGELEGRMGWSWSSILSMNPEWIRDGKVRNLVQFSTSKHADLPNVPLVTELATTDEDRALLELVFSRQVIGRPFIAPPGVDPETVQILRKAFDDTMKDPAFLAEMQKANLEVNPIPGKDVQELINRLFKTPPAVLERAKVIIPVEK
jgi:tripartite-type tricarboxylate transporter receptor subunit TctC